jgi:hypothetical protein
MLSSILLVQLMPVKLLVSNSVDSIVISQLQSEIWSNIHACYNDSLFPESHKLQHCTNFSGK